MRTGQGAGANGAEAGGSGSVGPDRCIDGTGGVEGLAVLQGRLAGGDGVKALPRDPAPREDGDDLSFRRGYAMRRHLA